MKHEITACGLQNATAKLKILSAESATAGFLQLVYIAVFEDTEYSINFLHVPCPNEIVITEKMWFCL